MTKTQVAYLRLLASVMNKDAQNLEAYEYQQALCSAGPALDEIADEIEADPQPLPHVTRTVSA